MIRPAAGARFASGDAVRVLDTEKEGHHIRTPDYAKGKPGWITQILGSFPNPESLAYGGDGLPEKPLYKVGFRQSDLWDSYEGSSEDILFIDIYEHWLESRKHGGEEKQP
jgi:nitrile hydratase subunit beta